MREEQDYSHKLRSLAVQTTDNPTNSVYIQGERATPYREKREKIKLHWPVRSAKFEYAETNVQFSVTINQINKTSVNTINTLRDCTWLVIFPRYSNLKRSINLPDLSLASTFYLNTLLIRHDVALGNKVTVCVEANTVDLTLPHYRWQS